MPTYGYECTSCSNQIEVIQSIKDAPLTICESCGGTLRKLIYPVGIAFKGSGFYVNDYAKKSEGGSTKAPASTESPATAAGADTKSETKSEPKPETTKSETKSEAAPATSAPVTTPAAAST